MVDSHSNRSDAYDPLTEESRRACFRLHGQAKVRSQLYGNQTYFHIEIPSLSKYIRLGYREYVFLSLLDGNTTIAHALAESSRALRSDALSEDQADQLVDWLLQQGVILAVDSIDEDQPDASSPDSSAGLLKWLQQCNPFWMKLPLTRLVGDPNRFLDACLPSFQWCFRPIGLMLMGLLITIGALLAAVHWTDLSQETTRVLVVNNWFGLIATWIILKLIHEFAHAMCCRQLGGDVREAGIVFILLAPMAYVDVTSSWALASRWKRMLVASAGMLVELCVASVALLFWFQVDSPDLRNMLINVMVTASISTVLFNANPLMRFDGYYLLSDLLKIPNLYESGTNSVRQTFAWIMYGRRSADGCMEIRKRWIVVGCYGWLATAWKLFIGFSLTIAASVMLGGWGILLAVFGLVSWYGYPIFNAGKGFYRRCLHRRHEAMRSAIVGLAGIALVTVALGYLPNPIPAHIPCVVDYEPLTKVRARSAGFIESVYVNNGEQVRRGDLLIRLENRELESRIYEAQAELELFRVQERIALDRNEPASVQMAIQDQAAARAKLNELRQEQESLGIFAPNDGVVIAPELNNRLGGYVDAGEILLTVGNDSSKEIVLSIATSDSRQLEHRTTDMLAIRLGCSGRKLATISRLDPRASTSLPHPSLGATYGGALAIKNGHDDKPELIKPRFVARAKMSDRLARSVKVGETGIAFLGRSQSLGAWLWLGTQEWIKEQWRFAKEMQ